MNLSSRPPIARPLRPRRSGSGTPHQAQRPLILAGMEPVGHRRRACSSRRRCERPSSTPCAASGQFPRDHHLVMGSVGEGGTQYALELIAASDCILRLGTTWWPHRYVPEAPSTIDINLRPDTSAWAHPPALASSGRSKRSCPQLVSQRPVARPKWEARVAEAKLQYEESLAQEIQAARQATFPTVHPRRDRRPQPPHPG